VDKRGDGHKRVLSAVSVNSGLERPYLPKIEKAIDDTFWWCGCGAPIQALHPMEGVEGCHMAGDPHGDKREVVRAHSGNSRVPGDYEGGREDGKEQSAHPRLLAVNQLMRPPTEFFCM
jgi:hypothetical protein